MPPHCKANAALEPTRPPPPMIATFKGMIHSYHVSATRGVAAIFKFKLKQ
jgi:hypothetical protein